MKPNTYSELTTEDKARIEKEFAALVNPPSTSDGSHLSAWIAHNIWKTDGYKNRAVDSNRWAAVLTYLVFTGKLKVSIALPVESEKV